MALERDLQVQQKLELELVVQMLILEELKQVVSKLKQVVLEFKQVVLVLQLVLLRQRLELHFKNFDYLFVLKE